VPRKKPPPPEEKLQRERFIEAAREAGVDETGEAFERAFAKIVPPKRPGADLSEPSAQPRVRPKDRRASKRRDS
jgi:hypothetical protein